jgi:2-polyprenyl-6-hydroxyphenyl methylase/3-demethylubiquinone-9 3-methyltransferase
VTTRVAGRVRDLGVRAGVLPYSRRWVLSADDWDREYGKGVLEYYGELRELARYSVLIGYLRELGGAPDVLDVGCGVGLLRGRLRADEVGRFVGTDPSSVAIERASEAHPGDEFVVTDLPDASLGPFDAVVCNEMLYYVEDLDALLVRIGALLKPGGRLLTSIVRHPGDVVLHRALDARFERLDAVVVQSKSGPGNAWRLACHRNARSTGT